MVTDIAVTWGGVLSERSSYSVLGLKVEKVFADGVATTVGTVGPTDGALAYLGVGATGVVRAVGGVSSMVLPRASTLIAKPKRGGFLGYFAASGVLSCGLVVFLLRD